MSRVSDTKKTIEKFRQYMARFGLIVLLHTKNGTEFKFKEFSQFLSKNVMHSVHHPFSNGQVKKQNHLRLN